MQIRPFLTATARHARLFELLRQENMALLARAKNPVPKANSTDAALAFRQMAEQSLSGAPVVL